MYLASYRILASAFNPLINDPINTNTSIAYTHINIYSTRFNLTEFSALNKDFSELNLGIGLKILII